MPVISISNVRESLYPGQTGEATVYHGLPG